MSLIEEIVNINISRATIGAESININSLLIIGDTNKAKNGQSRVKTYSSLTEVVSDFASTTKEYKAAASYFGQDPKPTRLLIGQVIDNSESFAAAYTAITLANNNFYGVMAATDDADSIAAIATAVEAENRIFGVSSSNIKAYDTTDSTSVFYKVKDKKRTFSFFNVAASSSYPEAAWFGVMLTKDAGSASWAYKNLSGVAADIFSTDQRTKTSTRNINYYTALAGREVTLEGKLMSGEFIDTIVGLDWITFELRTNIANALITSGKIPFTNAGIGVIESMVRNSLNLAGEREIVDANTIKVSVPDVRNVSETDRAARILPDVKFEARLAGAIHKVTIKGTVTI